MTDAFVILAFLALLAVVILGGARVSLWIYDENKRIDRVLRKGLEDIDNRRANDWDREVWWR